VTPEARPVPPSTLEGSQRADRRSVSLLATQRFVVLDVPHTGAALVRRACVEQLPMSWLIANDLPALTSYEELAEDFADLPMLAFVRNPWDWYATWYRVMTDPSARRSGAIWESAFGSGRSDFRTVVTRACTGKGFESPITGEIMRERGIDHYSALHVRVLGAGLEAGAVEIGRWEALADDFAAFCARNDVRLPDQLEAVLRGAAASVAVEPYRELYDEELRELVGDKAHAIVEAFGYRF
jgi:hypothetical protein